MNDLQERIKRVNDNAGYTLQILQAQQTIVFSWGATKFKGVRSIERCQHLNLGFEDSTKEICICLL